MSESLIVGAFTVLMFVWALGTRPGAIALTLLGVDASIRSLLRLDWWGFVTSSLTVVLGVVIYRSLRARIARTDRAPYRSRFTHRCSRAWARARGYRTWVAPMRHGEMMLAFPRHAGVEARPAGMAQLGTEYGRWYREVSWTRVAREEQPSRA